ncbi:MAG: hypothetical protein KBA26_02070 [Candidatus Delongbacteria bacterium]|nr:hypothetical protein [Candidatus Delongbacteria bacterium]
MESKSKRSLLIVITVILAAIVIYFGLFHQQPKPEEVSGTLGGVEKAQKLQGTTLNEEDIATLKTKYNDLLQSADFQNLVKSDNFQKVMGDANFYLALANPSLVNVIVPTAQSKEIQGLLQDSQFIKALNSGNNQQIMDVIVVRSLDGNTNLVNALMDPSIQKVMANPDYQAVIRSHEFTSLCQNSSFVSACQANELQGLVTLGPVDVVE